MSREEVLLEVGDAARMVVHCLQRRLWQRLRSGRLSKDDASIFRGVLSAIDEYKNKCGFNSAMDKLKMLDGTMAAGSRAYEPSADVIASGLAEIQAGWTESDRRRRAPHLAGDGPVIPERVEFAMR